MQIKEAMDFLRNSNRIKKIFQTFCEKQLLNLY